MNPTRLASNLSAAVVAGIAAWSSYHHMVEVALSVGERADVAYVLPLSVDGMLVVASAAMVDDRRSGRRVRWSARLAFVAGVIASVAANVAAAEATVGARIVAAWPAIALLLVVELLSRTGRLLTRHEAETDAAPIAPEQAPTVTPEPVTSQVITPVEVLPAAHETSAPEAPRSTPTDEQIIRDLRNPRRRPIKVSQRWVMDSYGNGPGRAKRLMAAAGVTDSSDALRALGEAANDRQTVNGHDHGAVDPVDALSN